MTDLRDEIRELALAAATGEVLELVLELKELKINLALELQATRDQRVAEHREWREFMAEMRGELDRIRADFRTDATLLHLIETPQTGEEQCQKKKNSSPRSLRGRFASSTN